MVSFSRKNSLGGLDANVRFESLANHFVDSSSMSASGGKSDAQNAEIRGLPLNVRISHYRSFKFPLPFDYVGLLTAIVRRQHDMKMRSDCRRPGLVSWKVRLAPGIHPTFHIRNVRKTHVLQKLRSPGAIWA
jgi:hypothetical protein